MLGVGITVATTIGHALVGMTVARSMGAGGIRDQWFWYAFAIFAANAPDLDLVPGFLINDPAYFHRLASHSLFGLLTFTGIVFVAARFLTDRHVYMTTLASIGYASHLVLDMPWIPWLWPLTPEFVPVSWAPIAANIQTTPGGDVATLIGELFSATNLLEIPKEVAAYLPPLLISWYLTNLSQERAA
ncbi:MAG: metal-dependent hydrolase [Rhodospirillales bacterium]|nr:metal-dependent hydrolase [Rhodospirillales bacterium]